MLSLQFQPYKVNLILFPPPPWEKTEMQASEECRPMSHSSWSAEAGFKCWPVDMLFLLNHRSAASIIMLEGH